MTVPVQRGNGPDDAVYNLLLDGMRDLKEQVVRLETHLGGRLDNLDQRYIPRSEYEARHSDVRNQITEQKAALAAEATQREQLEDQIKQGQRWAVGATLTGLGVLIAAIGLVVTFALSH